MVRDGVECSTHAEAEHGAGEETRKHQHVGAIGGRVPRRDDVVQPSAHGWEGEGAQEVRPNVDGFVVYVEERGEGPPIAVALGAVPRFDKVVIAPP